MHSFLQDIGIAIIAATIIGIITHKFKQPIILGYLIAGALIGPEIGFRFIVDLSSIEIISELGLILLLFIIGLEMDISKIIASGRQLLVAGIGQFILCVLLGLAFFSMLGYGLIGKNIDGLYLALLCGLSSTAVVVKLLYDKFELDTLHGRITLGVLIIQDIWAILILAFQPNLKNPQILLMVFAVLKSLALMGFGIMFSKYALKYLYGKIAKSPEMVVATSIGWCAFVAAIGGAVGLSKEMGALIAGVSIASFPYSLHVTAKILPLRDFFLTLFFISLGMQITILPAHLIFIVIGTVIFVIASRFFTVLPLILLSGGGLRTGFIASLNLAQISEFSLVIASLGIGYRHIHQDIMTVAIYSMAITCIMSSYFIKYNHQAYLLFDKLLNSLGIKAKSAKNAIAKNTEKHYPIVILGFHRGARELVKIISEKEPELLKKIVVIDFNTEILKELEDRGIAGIFGDISSVDTLQHAHMEHSKVIFSTIPDMLLKGTNNLKLVKTCRTLAPKSTIIATADFASQEDELRKAGANEVLLLYAVAGDYFANYLIQTDFNS